MGRPKINKEYAIRLTHPTLGVWYFSYGTNWTNFFFTQNLSKVNTRKIVNSLNKKIIEIKEALDRCNSTKIYLSFGVDINKLDKKIKDKLICSRKKFFYPITSVSSEAAYNLAKENVYNLNEALNNESKIIINFIEKRDVKREFEYILDRFKENIQLYQKNIILLSKNFVNVNAEAKLDITDASYGFRLLKLKTLRNIQNEGSNM